MQNKHKVLPERLTDRLSCLTPSKICDFKTQIHILKQHVDEIPNIESISNYYTYINVACRRTGKRSCWPINMVSSQYLIDKSISLITKGKKSEFVYDSAYENGWTDSDIKYDAIMHGLIIKTISESVYDGRLYEDMHIMNTNLNIAVYDYYDNQFVGWYMYHENLDSILHYSNKPL
jgi:hypothetical protein